MLEGLTHNGALSAAVGAELGSGGSSGICGSCPQYPSTTLDESGQKKVVALVTFASIKASITAAR